MLRTCLQIHAADPGAWRGGERRGRGFVQSASGRGGRRRR